MRLSSSSLCLAFAAAAFFGKVHGQYPGYAGNSDYLGGYACPDASVVNDGKWGKGTKYYVSPNGADESGRDGKTLENAWATLDHAVTRVPAQQDALIIVKAGTYDTDGDINVPRGVSIEGNVNAAGEPISILNYTGPGRKYTKVLALNNIGAKDGDGNPRIFDGNQFVKDLFIKGNAGNHGGVRSQSGLVGRGVQQQGYFRREYGKIQHCRIRNYHQEC